MMSTRIQTLELADMHDHASLQDSAGAYSQFRGLHREDEHVGDATEGTFGGKKKHCFCRSRYHCCDML